MKNILVLCTGNSCRSQMAEGFLRHYLSSANNKYAVYSAGLEAHGLNPRAVKAMAECGIDISSQQSETLDRYLDLNFEYVITVCDHAQESCPVFPGAKKMIHQSFSDPAKATGTEEEIMASFRATRNEIDVFCKNFIHQIAS